MKVFKQYLNILNKDDKVRIFKRTVTFFLPFFLIACLITIITLLIFDKFELKNYKKFEKKIITIPTQGVKKDVADITSDLLIFANSNEITQIIASPKTKNNEVLNNFSNELLLMAKFKKKYDQIRLLDEKGMEIIRINFNNGFPSIVRKKDLQNKSERYYFNDTFKLSEGEIYISPLDLNIERGEIEKPLKPMIRVATPIFDNNHKKRGIVLLNYLGNNLINNFKQYRNILNEENLLLLNSDGYWLCSNNSEEEWGFMFKDKKEISFKNKYTQAWEKIISSSSGQFETSAGLFTFETIFPLLEGQKSATGSGEAFKPSSLQLNSEEYFWKSVSFIPTDILNKSSNKRQLYALISIIIIGTIFLYSSFKIAINTVHREIFEKKLIENEKNLRSVFEAARNVAFVKTDLNGKKLKILEFSPGAEQIFGYKREEIIGKPLALLNIEENIQKFPNAIKSMSENKKGFREESILVRKPGKRFHALIMSQPIFDQNEKMVAAIWVAIDISKLKEAEEKIKQSEHRFDLAIKGANLGLWDWMIQTGETIFNDRWAEMLGYSLKELSPINIDTWSKLIHPDDLKKIQSLLDKHFSGETDIFICEMRMKHKNGNWIWILERGKVFEWDKDGKPVRMVGTHLNISAQKREELLREHLIKDLKGKLDIKEIPEGNIPICSSCYKIRIENEKWTRPDAYFSKHFDILFTHGICPDCIKKLYPEYYERMKTKEKRKNESF